MDTTAARSLLAEPGPDGHVDEFAVQVYEHALGRGAVTPEALVRELDASRRRVDEAVGVLRGLRLVKDAAGSRGELVAVDTEAAQFELLVPLEQAIHDNRRRLAGVKGQLQSFMEAFNSNRRDRPRGESVVVTDDPEEIRLRLMDAARQCTGEILLMQPCVAQEPTELRHAHPVIMEALRRGVRAQALYPHTARGDAATRARVAALTEAGGQVRTSREIHGRFLAFDRKVAFVPADSEAGVAIVYEPSVATFLGSIHDLVWQSAFPLEPGTVGYAETLDDLRSTILELLASGIKDEVVARRIGMSDRSFRRHVAAIMQDLAADSRFQAGVRAAHAGLVGSAQERQEGRLHSPLTMGKSS